MDIVRLSATVDEANTITDIHSLWSRDLINEAIANDTSMKYKNYSFPSRNPFEPDSVEGVKPWTRLASPWSHCAQFFSRHLPSLVSFLFFLSLLSRLFIVHYVSTSKFITNRYVSARRLNDNSANKLEQLQEIALRDWDKRQRKM